MSKTATLHTELIGDREILFTREVNAPRELVFKAYTDRDMLAAWWGPHTFSTEMKTFDPQPGGTWHYCMRSEEWGDAWGIAVYEEITPPERIVYTDAFSDEEGSVIPPESTVTVTFGERDGKTLLSMHTLFASRDDRDKVIEMGVEQGLGESMERLDAVVAGAA